jgi:hypothetical protein
MRWCKGVQGRKSRPATRIAGHPGLTKGRCRGGPRSWRFADQGRCQPRSWKDLNQCMTCGVLHSPRRPTAGDRCPVAAVDWRRSGTRCSPVVDARPPSNKEVPRAAWWIIDPHPLGNRRRSPAHSGHVDRCRGGGPRAISEAPANDAGRLTDPGGQGIDAVRADGGVVHVRPVRPEDASLLRDLHRGPDRWSTSTSLRSLDRPAPTTGH